MLNLVVEGWRFYPQSFSIVNQFQCLELLKRDDVRLYHREMPPQKREDTLSGREWIPDESALSPDAAAKLKAIPPPPDDLVPDAVFRIFFPYDFAPAAKGRTFVFAVTGTGRVPPTMIAGKKPLEETLTSPDVTIITPSAWSRQGVLSGVMSERQVAVVPHGVDTDIFRPAGEDERRALRRKFGWDDYFIYLYVGGPFWWKNPELLLKAAAFVANKHAEARVVLKGTDAVYPSSNMLAELAPRFTPKERSVLDGRMQYIGGTLSYARLADLYRAADVLVLPYVNEGFCLPALEAMACGLPVVCTKGGPTDDFLSDDVALFVKSDIKPPGTFGARITIHADSLATQMLRAIGDKDFAPRAREMGPVRARDWTWTRAVDKFVEVLSGRGAP